MSQEYIIAYADKSVLKISGLSVKGMSTTQVEKILQDKLKAIVRVIGVTGESIEMDVYDAEPDQIRKNADGAWSACRAAASRSTVTRRAIPSACAIPRHPSRISRGVRRSSAN